MYHSDGHPNLERIEKSTVMHQALMAASTRGTGVDNGEGSTKSTQIRLKDSDVALYCRNHEINSLTELLADCQERLNDGDDTLHSYIHSRTLKQLNELLLKNELMSNAPTKAKLLKANRMTTLKSHCNTECVGGCNGLWYTCAIDILRRSKINKYVFADAIRELLEKGRGRGRNIFIMGPTSSGKTFILKPLLDIYP